ncbi:MAG: hypothetical protein ABFC90_07905 [Bacteroidales bacterium]|nr:hypothetical protein [Bacteroidales bacterium]
MRKRINIKEAEALLEKYYEGNTSQAEEKRLYHFLLQDHLPEKFEADCALFGFFANQKQKPKAVIIPLMRWASIAAVMVGIIVFAKTWVSDNPTNIAYINGQKYTDIQVVKEQAMSSLKLVSSLDEVEECVKNLNDKDLIESQLAIFNDIH